MDARFEQGQQAKRNFQYALEQLAEARVHLAEAQAILLALLASGGRP